MFTLYQQNASFLTMRWVGRKIAPIQCSTSTHHTLNSTHNTTLNIKLSPSTSTAILSTIVVSFAAHWQYCIHSPLLLLHQPLHPPTTTAPTNTIIAGNITGTLCHHCSHLLLATSQVLANLNTIKCSVCHSHVLMNSRASISQPQVLLHHCCFEVKNGNC